MKLIIFLSILISTAIPVDIAFANSNIYFTVTPPAQGVISDNITAAWSSRDTNVQFRFKIDAPGDWMGGIKYNLNKWSTWGDWRSVSMSDFVLEGNYTIVVEARDAKGTISKNSTRFRLRFLPPQIRDEGIKIDWSRARSAKTKSERYRILAEEYRQAYNTWIAIYDRERRVLRSSWSGEEMIGALSGAVVGKGNDMLLKWADAGVSATLGRILAPKTLYDIAKQTGINIVLIYRNQKTNEAAFKALTSYWAWKGYEDLASKAR